MPKYKNEKNAINSSDLYQELFENRGIKFARQRRTFVFTGLDFDTIQVSEYVWRQGDSLYKLSNLFYGTLDFWWVIAFVNKKPTDAHYNYGDTIFIPKDPMLIVEAIGR